MAKDHIHYTEDGESVAGVDCIRCGDPRAFRVDVSEGGSLYECPECGVNFIV